MNPSRWSRAAIALVAAVAVACSSHHHWIAAKFSHGTSWIRFDPGGHFSLNVGGQFGAGGTYEIDGRDITLRLDAGGTRQGEIEGRTFRDWFGTRYRRTPYRHP
jgi:hypothetical protein